MNLLTVSVFLLSILAFQPTLIYGSAKRKSHASISTLDSSASKDLVNSAKLVMSMKSGDVLIRSARGAAGENTAQPEISNNNNNNENAKRQKHNNNNGQKNHKNQSNGENNHKHSDRKFSSTTLNQDQQHQVRGHNKGKERNVLNIQKHHNDSKRSGLRLKSEKTEKGSKTEHGKSQSTCRYAKSAWTECDAKTNMRTRTLTLKNGEANCPTTRTMTKKCKKACRYEKGAWTECQNGQMTREDKLKTTGSATNADPSCEPVRTMNKKCGTANKQQRSKSNKERKHKDKASRRAPQQA